MAKGFSKLLAVLVCVLLASFSLAKVDKPSRVLGTSINSKSNAGKVEKLRKIRGERPSKDINAKTGGPRKLKQREVRPTKDINEKTGGPRKLKQRGGAPKERGYNGNSGTRGYYKSSKGYYYDDDHYWDYPNTEVPGTYYPKTYYPKTQPPKYYYPHSGKGKAGKKSHKGKGKGGYYYDDNFYPTVDDIPFFDDQFFDDAFFEDDDCELVTFNETFSFAGPTLFLAPDTTVSDPGTPSLPGTVFIFEESPIFELQTDDVEIEGTAINGVCTRTTVGEDGGGMCQLTFVDDEGYTINVSGYLQGPFGSQMAVTGGTGSTTGIVGTMDFFPEFGDLDADAIGDIFLDTTRFDVIAEIGIIVCPAPYH